MSLIREAMSKGARKSQACATFGISKRTLSRWRKKGIIDKRKGALKIVKNKLSIQERQQIVDVACSPDYRDLTCWEIVPKLADFYIYLGSVRTFYRVLSERGLLYHRNNQAVPRRVRKPPVLAATGPNQVWSWDITYVCSFVRGIYFFAYLIMDIFTKKIVGWEISDRESDQVAAGIMLRISREKNISGVHLHSDNGHPMKGATMIMTLYQLGVIPTFSRPRVSDDNPYSESLFKTVKYHRTYPGKFETLEDTRIWFAGFIHWYNTEHLHSGIGYVTPEARESGLDQEIFARRNATYAQAYAAHPERWSRPPKVWDAPKIVYLNAKSEHQNKEKIA